MPSLDLYDPSAHADGWHDVRAPGGYEWWYFDAEDAAADTQVVAIFMEGFIFHPGYLRAYERFRRRPTRVAPPVAGDYPCVYLCVYRGGRIWKQSFTQLASGTLLAARDRCDVTIGKASSVRSSGDAYDVRVAGTPWHLTARGPQRIDIETLGASLTFTPTQGRSSGPVQQRAFLSRELTGAEHRWSIIAPACDVAGRIECGDASIDFRGRGYHDHNYGTAPIGDGLARWTWGRAMFEGGRVVTFHHAEPRDASRLAETHLVEAGADATRDLTVDRVVGDWSNVSRPAMFLRYPRTLDFGPALNLSEPRVIDPSPFYLRLQFKAESFGQTSTAFCEIAYPHRLRWPLLGRMIEMSFDKRAVKTHASTARP